MKSTLIVCSLIAVVCLGLAACTSGSNYETAPFQVIRRDGAFEIREYPALTVATTKRSGDDGSFMRLFRFIDGANEPKEKISMTTPVFMTGDEMSFVMPEKHRSAPPKPISQQVEVKTLPGRRVAVYRYSGRGTRANELGALRKLNAWLDANKIQHGQESVVAYYDPPWTLPPFRRNEVMVPVK